MLTLHFFDTKTDDDVFYFLLGGSFCITTEILKRITYLIIRKKQVQIHISDKKYFPPIDTDLMTEQYLYSRLDALRVAN